MNSSYYVRRLAPNEIGELEVMQKRHKPQIEQDYPGHREWLKRAIADLKKGTRIGFGAFDFMQTSVGPEQQLRGLVLIKRVISGIEAKSLIVAPQKNDDMHERSQIADQLIEKVEKFATRRGFESVTIEFPDSEHEQIHWFLRRNYKILMSPTQQRHSLHRSYYALRKTLEPAYSGDPFDALSVVRWLLVERLGFKLLESRPMQWDADSQGNVFCGLYKFRLNPESGNIDTKDSFTINGRCLVDLGYGKSGDLIPLLQKLNQEKEDIALFATFRSLASEKNFCNGTPIRYIDSKILAASSGYGNSLKHCPVQSDTIGGVLLEIGDHARKAIEKKIRKGGVFSYVVVSGLGLTLARTENFEGKTALFGTLEFKNGATNFMIWGYATIADIQRRKFESVFEKIPPQMQIWENREEHDFYVNEITVSFTVLFNEDGRVPIYEFSDIRLLESPIRLYDIASENTKKFLNLDSSDDDVVTTYIDENTIGNIKKLPVKNLQTKQEDTLLTRYKLDSAALEVLELLRRNKHPKIRESLGLNNEPRNKEKKNQNPKKNLKDLVQLIREQRGQDQETRQEPLFGQNPKAKKVIEVYASLESEINWYNSHCDDLLTSQGLLEDAVIRCVRLTNQFLEMCKKEGIRVAGFDDLFEVFSRFDAPPASTRTESIGIVTRGLETRKVLFFAASPDNTPLKLDEECREIEKNIKLSGNSNRLELVTKWAVRPEDFISSLNQHVPTIVHFSGHGTTSAEIIVLGSDRKPKPISVDALVRLFSVMKGKIRIVVLNACYSESQAEAIVEHIDCVVGMSKSISDEAAITFAGQFYQSLAFDGKKSVKAAFDEAITALALYGIKETETPVLKTKSSVKAEDLFLA